MSPPHSKPVDGRYHDFAGCGWHYSRFDRETGHAEYRKALKEVLERYEEPLTMKVRSEIVHLTPSEFTPLLVDAVPAGTDSDLVTSRIDAAKATFERRNTTLADRRHAVRELADVLEVLRSDIKEEMLPKDEQEPFRLARFCDPPQQPRAIAPVRPRHLAAVGVLCVLGDNSRRAARSRATESGSLCRTTV